jgi:hypothetical protein
LQWHQTQCYWSTRSLGPKRGQTLKHNVGDHEISDVRAKERSSEFLGNLCVNTVRNSNKRRTLAGDPARSRTNANNVVVRRNRNKTVARSMIWYLWSAIRLLLISSLLHHRVFDGTSGSDALSERYPCLMSEMKQETLKTDR